MQAAIKIGKEKQGGVKKRKEKGVTRSAENPNGCIPGSLANTLERTERTKKLTGGWCSEPLKNCRWRTSTVQKREPENRQAHPSKTNWGKTSHCNAVGNTSTERSMEGGLKY